MNETIKTYTEITVEEAAQLQSEGWKDFCLGHVEWGIYNLDAIAHCGCANPFYCDLSNSWYPRCAKVTEIDPCKAPGGCPELEPWMAYVGFGKQNKRGSGHNFIGLHGVEWHAHKFGGNEWHYAIDVRTEWAQEHFPEHCRIRNYQEPNPLQAALEEFVRGDHTDRDLSAFRSGWKAAMNHQANPNKEEK